MPATKSLKPSKAIKTLERAVEQLRQEAAAIQIRGQALTSEEQKRVKALNRATDLVDRALKTLS